MPKYFFNYSKFTKNVFLAISKLFILKSYELYFYYCFVRFIFFLLFFWKLCLNLIEESVCHPDSSGGRAFLLLIVLGNLRCSDFTSFILFIYLLTLGGGLVLLIYLVFFIVLDCYYLIMYHLIHFTYFQASTNH